MTPTRTPDGKVVLYHAETGERFVRFPVDARAMLQTGAYTTEPTDTASVTVAVPPDASPAPRAVFAGAAFDTETKSEADAALQATQDMLATQQSPTGAPLVLSAESTPAQPMQAPTRQQGRRR